MPSGTAERGVTVRAFDLDDAADRGVWDRFCRASGDAWFWHTSDWLRYQRAHRPDLASRHRSFFVEDGGAILAACPLLEEAGELGAGGSAAPAPIFAPNLGARRRAEVAATLFAEVDAVAARTASRRVSFRLSPLAPA